MMMEDEIEQIKAETRGIDEACDKVEEVLGRLIEGDAAHVDTVLQEDQKMGDIWGQGGLEGADIHVKTEPRPNWFENERLRRLWDGNG